MMSNTTINYLAIWSNSTKEEVKEYFTKIDKQRKEITNKENYILDPFKGYIKRA